MTQRTPLFDLLHMCRRGRWWWGLAPTSPRCAPHRFRDSIPTTHLSNGRPASWHLPDPLFKSYLRSASRCIVSFGWMSEPPEDFVRVLLSLLLFVLLFPNSPGHDHLLKLGSLFFSFFLERWPKNRNHSQSGICFEKYSGIVTPKQKAL